MIVLQILGVLGSMIIGLIAMLLSPIAEGLYLILVKYREGTSAISHKTIIRWFLDAGLAGDTKARSRYSRSRILGRQDLPDWIVPIIQSLIRGAKQQPVSMGHIAQIEDSIIRAEMSKKLSSLMSDADNRLEKHLFSPGPYATRQKEWRNYHMASIRLMGALNQIAARRWLIGLMNDGTQDYATATTQRHELFNQIADQVLSLIASSIWLEDFLSLHPCQLQAHEKIVLIQDRQDPWQLCDHPTIKNILEAESELRDTFDRYHPTTEERQLCVRRLTRSTITQSSLRKVKEWLIERKRAITPTRSTTPQLAAADIGAEPAISRCHTPVTISRKDLVRVFARGLTSLSRLEQNQVRWLIIKVDDKGLESASTLIDQLASHPVNDILPYLELRYHELMAMEVELETPDQAIRPIVPPKLPPEETADQLLARIDTARTINCADIGQVRKLIGNKQLTPDQLSQAITHLVFFRLANDSGHIAGLHRPYRVLLSTLPKRYSLPGLQAEYNQVISQAVKDGSIIHRHADKRPGLTDPVKLDPAVMYKYHG